MLDTEDLTEHDIVALIKEVRQGDGLNVGSVQKWFAVRQQDSSVTDAEARRLVTDLNAAIALVPNADQRGAVSNALGLTWGRGETLTDRRMNYLAQVDISLRTLIRYEDAGALATGEALMAMWHGDVSATDVDLDRVDAHLITITRRLRNIDARVENLSQKVEQMNDLLARLVTMSDSDDDGLPFRQETYATRESAYKKRSATEDRPTSLIECGPVTVAPRNLLEDAEGSSHK